MKEEGFEGDISETCGLLSCFHETNCLGPDFVFESQTPRVHHLCPSALLLRKVSLAQHCFPVSVHPSCHKMF